MCAAIVNSLGLGMDIVGAALIWRFGLPESISREGTEFIVSGGKDEKEIGKARRYDHLSAVGFALLILGFVVQILSNWI